MNEGILPFIPNNEGYCNVKPVKNFSMEHKYDKEDHSKSKKTYPQATQVQNHFKI